MIHDSSSRDPLSPSAGGIGPAASPGTGRRAQVGVLLVAVLLAVVARGAVLALWPENLSDDRDAYLALAQGVLEGRGLSVPGSETPTAYRPPLYPLLLAPFSSASAVAERGGLQLLMGALTVGLTYVLGLRLGLGPASFLAAALVAVDPLLLRYTTFPMTETLATLLVVAFLLAVVAARLRDTVGRQICAGVLFGLCALCRPTIWAYAGLSLLTFLVVRGWGRDRGTLDSWRVPWWSIAAALLVVSPWVLRNLASLGHPVLMTTHGGYTLLLGNNPQFYEEVVRQPWGTVWDGSQGGGQAGWVEAVNREMDQEGVTGEVARDRWMARRARAYIRAAPLMFARACLLRLTRFWSVVPTGADGDHIAPGVRGLVGGFYCVLFAGAAWGLVVIVRDRRWSWTPCLLMLAAFVAVHLVYWTNARMRAPVSPVIALLFAAGLASLWRRPTGSARRCVTC